MPPADDPAPPFLGRWRTIYAIVLLKLALDMGLLFAFTLLFR